MGMLRQPRRTRESRRAIAFGRGADIPSPHRGEGERHVVAKRDSPGPEGEREGPIAQQWEGEGCADRAFILRQRRGSGAPPPPLPPPPRGGGGESPYRWEEPVKSCCLRERRRLARR